MPHVTKVQSRGRVTIPAGVRQALQLESGDDVVFIETAPGRFEIKAEVRNAALLRRQRSSRLEVPVPASTTQMKLPI
ncbi:AbrB/MazE/SpoVT family DNA-binding domain-containing protein [Aquincola sp. S2]|uniref:AbrB/MazE/SpoVT family DNA-binding domain-containing protein n=1 Tax=Pseudaquabacterium terrae TaxID=2732868 RepID=A0ABX2EU53_9BURK|nr:AbrB/MazE/SpoVT family DNA-binding domain-containing protein [Aquabacterium terrae]NRF72245.1 AbrB/MazE/SpoVT family DNA-binding domain-containing protein [Aquabacterium terrae]